MSEGVDEGTGVCLNGVVRTFVLPLVHTTIRRNLLSVLPAPVVVVAALTLEQDFSAGDAGHKALMPGVRYTAVAADQIPRKLI